MEQGGSYATVKGSHNCVTIKGDNYPRVKGWYDYFTMKGGHNYVTVKGGDYVTSKKVAIMSR